MKMHEHDQEIIMALAEGTLDDAAAAAATAEIAACAECSADLDLQRFALEALDAVPDVYLTATESARLHADLKRELSVATPQSAQQKRSFAWGRWLPVAGVAAAFLLVIAALPTLFGGFGGSDDSGDEVAAAETTAAAADRGETATTAAAMEMAADSLQDDLADGADGTMNLEATEAPTAAAETTTTMVGAATTAAPAVDLDLYDLLDFRGVLTDELRTEILSELAGEATTKRLSMVEVASLNPFVESCLLEKTTAEIAPSLGIPVDSEPFLMGLTGDGTGEEYLLVAFVPESIENTVIASVSIELCSVIELLP